MDSYSTTEALPLFRREAVDHKRHTWLGDIVLARPVSFAALTAGAVALAALLVGYCIVGEYTKKARVSGYLVPDQGVLKVMASAPGVVTALRVREGQQVRRGEPLATLSAERMGSAGSMQATIGQQLAARQASLAAEIQKTEALFEQQLQSSRVRLTQLGQEHAQLGRAIELQQERVRLAETAYERNARLAADRFISESALQDKRADLLDQRNRLNDLQRARTSLERDIASTEADIASVPLKKANAVAALQRSRAELVATAAENETQREEVLVAPQDGTVTALQMHEGKQVVPGVPLLSVIPSSARLEADLYVPSRSAGFIRIGSQARLQYQAFPYQKFGTQEGVVVRISRTAVPASELPFPAQGNEVYYVVSVLPRQGWVEAYGRREPLQSGMQLDADIWLDRRTLLEWILEPLFSVSGRL